MIHCLGDLFADDEDDRAGAKSLLGAGVSLDRLRTLGFDRRTPLVERTALRIGAKSAISVDDAPWGATLHVAFRENRPALTGMRAYAPVSAAGAYFTGP
ncbi:hypothetical protein [Sorangium sp. So ce124]|uniref:hypothetical protein n=1 Tax=Sorangium sp. So ce124 TaxID=3133280 RepID=UPI003F618583